MDLMAVQNYEFHMSLMYTGTRFILHTGEWFSGKKWERCQYTPELESAPGLVGLDEIVSSVKLYPNPVENELNINWGDGQAPEVEKTELLSITGKTLKQWLNTVPAQIDVSNLAKGPYLLRLTNGQEVWLKKFLKN